MKIGIDKGQLYINDSEHNYRDINLDLNCLFQFAVDRQDMILFYPEDGKIRCMYTPKGVTPDARVGEGDSYEEALYLAKEMTLIDERERRH